MTLVPDKLNTRQGMLFPACSSCFRLRDIGVGEGGGEGLGEEEGEEEAEEEEEEDIFENKKNQKSRNFLIGAQLVGDHPSGLGLRHPDPDGPGGWGQRVRLGGILIQTGPARHHVAQRGPTWSFGELGKDMD